MSFWVRLSFWGRQLASFLFSPRPQDPTEGRRLPPTFLSATIFALTVFIIYLLTLAPSVSGGDSGDLLTAICNSGVPHPPGYPLYVLLGKLLLTLFNLSPIGPLTHLSPAGAINVSSALYGTLAALFLYLTIFKITRSYWSGWTGAGLFAFAPVVWQYAVSSEVFALNNLFTTLILFLFVLYLDRRTLQLASLLFLVFGLGMSNHHSLLFIGIPAAGYLFWDLRSQKGGSRKLIFYFCLGLSPYLYLPWAGAHNLATSWGQTDTLPGFLIHVLRSEYGTFRLSPDSLASTNGNGSSDLGKILWDLFSHELMGIGAFVILIGIIKAFQGNRKSALLGRVCALSGGTYFLLFFIFNPLPAEIALKTGVHLRFLQFLLVPLFVFFGVGFSSLFRRPGLQALASFVLISLQIGLHFSAQNQKENYASLRYGKAYLDHLPKNSVLLLSGDGAYYPINYLQACEHYRTDISVIPRGLMNGSWMVSHLKAAQSPVTFSPKLVSGSQSNFESPLKSQGQISFNLKQFLDLNFDHLPLFISGYDPGEDNSWEQSYTTWPLGFSNRIYRRDDPSLDRERQIQDSISEIHSLDFSDLSRFPKESWENNYFRTYKETYSRLAMAIAVQRGHGPPRLSDLILADTYFREYFKNNPYPAPQALQDWQHIQSLLSGLEGDHSVEHKNAKSQSRQ